MTANPKITRKDLLAVHQECLADIKRRAGCASHEEYMEKCDSFVAEHNYLLRRIYWLIYNNLEDSIQ